MASWIVSFNLLPYCSLVESMGKCPEVIPIVRPASNQTLDELRSVVSQIPNYWNNVDCSVIELEKLLAPRESWSKKARMYGLEDGNGIEIWRDEDQIERIEIIYSLLNIDHHFIRSSLKAAFKMNCMLHSQQTGNIIQPQWRDLDNEVRQHMPTRHVENWNALAQEIDL
jgi:hypothetical protein